MQGVFRGYEGAICTSVWASTQMFSITHTLKLAMHMLVHQHTLTKTSIHTRVPTHKHTH